MPVLADACTRTTTRTGPERPAGRRPRRAAVNGNTGPGRGQSGTPHPAFCKANWRGAIKSLKYRDFQGPRGTASKGVIGNRNIDFCIMTFIAGRFHSVGEVT